MSKLIKNRGLILGIVLVITVLIIFSFSRSDISFKGVISNMEDSYIIVKPLENEREIKSADKISIPINLISEIEAKERDTIEIVYDGIINESYPAQLGEIYSIKLIEE